MESIKCKHDKDADIRLSENKVFCPNIYSDGSCNLTQKSCGYYNSIHLDDNDGFSFLDWD